MATIRNCRRTASTVGISLKQLPPDERPCRAALVVREMLMWPERFGHTGG
jgi:hypothetical protein